MKAVILAGGLGTRLRPLTNTLPKPMVPIQGKPLLEHILTHLKKHDVEEAILSIGYLAEKVQEHFRDDFQGMKITYVIEEEPLGTGGAVKQAAEGIQEPFLLLWGDNLHDVDLTELMKKEGKLVMTLTQREDVENFGVAHLEGEKILHFVEKPKREDAPSQLINAGIFKIHPALLSSLPEGKSSIEKDLFEKLETIRAFIHEGQWFPTDTMEKYEKANASFK